MKIYFEFFRESTLPLSQKVFLAINFTATRSMLMRMQG